MLSPNKVYRLKKCIIGCVDDKRQYLNDWDKNKLETITKQLQIVVQSCEHLLYTSGGKLERSKCGLYLIEWKFYVDGRVILAPRPNIAPFTITSSFDDTQYVITLLSNNDCMKYLGIQYAPSGNQYSQYKS